MRWLNLLADRTHPLALPGVWVVVSLSYFYAIFSSAGGESCCWENTAQLWGAILNSCLITAYLFAAGVYLYRGHRAAVRTITPLVADPASVNDALADPGGWPVMLAALLGGGYGLLQFGGLLTGSIVRTNPPLDLSMVVASVVMWGTIAFFSACRVSDALALRRLGSRMQIDLYDLNRLKPFGRVAIRDVLAVMGALALMPLQALDAEFRLINYRDGLIVGLVISCVLFLLPQSGIRQAVQAAKAARVAELQHDVDGMDRADVAGLEALVAHRDRVRHLPSWPLDLSLIGRVVFYLIIPPLAWVGAALVEMMVEGFVR